MPSPKTMHSVELFTGAGGLALGTHRAGFRHKALLEWDSTACATLDLNIGSRAIRGISDWKVTCGDVRDFDFAAVGGVELVAGGPPCQPFSLGGKHGGMRDERDMIPQFVRAVRELKPRAFIMENVKGLTRDSFSNYFQYIQLQLTYPSRRRKPRESWSQHLGRLEQVHTAGSGQRLAYNVVTRLLNAADYGVPQTRERVFIVGFRSDLDVEWSFPAPTHSKKKLLHDQWVSGSYWKRHGIKAPAGANERHRKQIERMHGAPSPQGESWLTVRDAISDLPRPSSADPGHRIQQGARAYPGHTGSPMDWPSKTLKAGVHGVPGGENMLVNPNGTVRYFTIREAARIQTFPDTWDFKGAWSLAMRQLGNAVPLRLASVVAESVATKLRETLESL